MIRVFSNNNDIAFGFDDNSYQFILSLIYILLVSCCKLFDEISHLQIDTHFFSL